MKLTDNDLKDLIYNPSYIQKVILDTLETNEEKSINIASNPFVLALESIVATSSAVAMQTKTIIRSIYPSLASNLEEIQLHLTEDEIPSLFSTPATTEIIMAFQLTHILDYGHTAPKSNFSEIVIPVGTKISVANYDLTFLNDLFIRLYPSTYTVDVELVNNDNVNSINNVSILHGIIHNVDGLPMIFFKVPIKQVSVYERTKSVVVSSGFKYIHKLKDKFWYAECFYKGKSTGNTLVPIGLTFSEEYLDPNVPKVSVKVGSEAITFEISDIYLISGKISGEVVIKVYETKGKTYLPLDRYTADKFKYVYGKSNLIQAKGLAQIPVVVRSESVLSGGTDALDFEVIKRNYIEKTLGKISLPVTAYQLSSFAKSSGLNISLLEDTIHSRIFIATTELPDDLIKVSSIKSIPDTFNNTVGFVMEDYAKVFPDCVKDDSFLIKSNTIFLEINGQFFVKTPKELYNINQQGLAAKLKHYNENNYYYNPFYYIVDVKTNITECRAYHLDNPKLENLRILDKNLNLQTINSNVDKFGITKQDDGYIIRIKLNGNKGFNDIDKSNLFLQCSIDLIGNNQVHFTPEYDKENDLYFFKLEVDYFIDYLDRITIKNGNSLMSYKQSLLETKLYIYGYTIDPNIQDPYNYMVSEIFNAPSNTSVIFKSRVNLLFGKKLEYLWNKVFNTFTDRQYKRYVEDIPAKYEEDIFERDIDGKVMFHVTDDDKLQAIRLHTKGDLIRDPNGEVIIKHKKGSVILDKNGEPIIDTISGCVRYVDILMLEYVYRLASGDAATTLNQLLVEHYEKLLFYKMAEVNSVLLERTKIFFRSNRSCRSLVVSVNDSETYVQYLVSPTIHLYISKTLQINPTIIETYKAKIGIIIFKHLNKETINSMEIKQEIMESLDIPIFSIKIENLIPGDQEVMTIKNNNNRLTLKKNIIETEYKELQIIYGIDLKLIKI